MTSIIKIRFVNLLSSIRNLIVGIFLSFLWRRSFFLIIALRIFILELKWRPILFGILRLNIINVLIVSQEWPIIAGKLLWHIKMIIFIVIAIDIFML